MMKTTDDNIKQRSIFSRFAASTALFTALLIGIAIFFFQLLHKDFFARAFDSPLRDWGQTIAAYIHSKPELAPRIAKQHQVGVIIKSADYDVAYDHNGHEIEPSVLQQESNDFRKITVLGHTGFEVSLFLDHDAYSVEGSRLLIGLIITIILLVSGIYLVQLSLLTPLHALKKGVDAVAKGDFKQRVKLIRNDEIGQVGEAFNTMTQRVETMIKERDRLLADVSHELRSPMARIKVALELLENNSYVDSIQQDVTQLEEITTSLLERERLIAGASLKEKVDLDAIINQILQQDDLRQVIYHSPDVPIEIIANKEMMQVLLQNLIDNGIKFSKPNSKPVEVSLSLNSNEIELLVEDDGIGVDNSDTAIIFDPFVKLDEARGHQNGYGLGLNLCQRIVQAHHGTISAVVKPEGGLLVSVTLSKNDP